jgi:hypothetical protein
MGKIIRESNFRVEVYPRSLGNFGIARISDTFIQPDEVKRNQQYKEDCESMQSDNTRHVDGVGSVDVVCDSEPICSFCGYRWTGKTDVYNGGCCEKDEAISLEEIEAAEAKP